MKKFKKFLSVLCAVSMVMAMAAPAFAAEATTTVDLAYMDTQGVSPELKQCILEARRDIIYSSESGWSVDGSARYYHTDGTFEYLPKFSELFPGWDLAEICALNPGGSAGKPIFSSTRTNFPSNFSSDNIKLTDTLNYTATVFYVTERATPFYSFNSTGEKILLMADSLPGTKYHAGIYNEDSKKDDAYKSNMTLGTYITLETKSNVRYSCRASMDVKGEASLYVCTYDYK